MVNMCGITGFNFEDSKLIRKMTDQLKHRGPDDHGYYTDRHVSLGHRRLSIIDLSRKGRQPMSNSDGTVWITYNGEVYNYKEIRQALEGKYKFMSSTDTEVIIHAYEEYGLDFLKKLRGMFAFCIYDSRKKILILARDNVGKKPLYYYFDGDKFIFASEIKAILQCDIHKSLDRNALISYLAFQYSIGEQTMFSGIKKVLGGHYLILDLKTKELKTQKYWDIREDILQRDVIYFIKRLRELLEESASLRLRSDVPVGAFLSGGIDSSIAVAFARDKVDYDFHTFSMGFEHFSELDYARKVAEYLDTEHHEIIIREKDVIKHFPKVAWHFDEPVGDAATIANYFLAQYARRHVKVILAGEAGDELFAGYDNYRDNMRYHVKLPIPKAGRKMFSSFIRASPLYIKGNPWTNRNIRRLHYISQTDLARAHLYTTMGLSEHEIPWLLKDKSGIDVYGKAIIPRNIRNPLNYVLALDLKNILPEKFLMKADKATMANSVEERLVIMDKEIVEFSYKIPPGLKIRENRGKWILRKAGKERLKGVKEILWRGKQGFGVPIDSWIKSELRDYVLQRLEGGFIRKNFDVNAIKTIEKNLIKGNIKNYHNSLVTWTLFALEEWYEQYLT
jgi:asparagine synthase (glutamine-hydrolysing)